MQQWFWRCVFMQHHLDLLEQLKNIEDQIKNLPEDHTFDIGWCFNNFALFVRSFHHAWAFTIAHTTNTITNAHTQLMIHDLWHMTMAGEKNCYKRWATSEISLKCRALHKQGFTWSKWHTLFLKSTYGHSRVSGCIGLKWGSRWDGAIHRHSALQ